jgi:hypothetical protein
MTGRPISVSPAEHARRVHLCVAAVTLDGAPARIFGPRNDFAKVCRRDGKGGDVEFSWPAAARIVADGGAFKS